MSFSNNTIPTTPPPMTINHQPNNNKNNKQNNKQKDGD